MASPQRRGATAPAAGLTTTSPVGTQIGDLVIVFTFERLGSAVNTTLSLDGSMDRQLCNFFHGDGSTDGALGVAVKVTTVAGAQSYQGFTSSTGSPNAVTGCEVLQAGTFDPEVLNILVGAPTTSTNSSAPNPGAITSLDAGVEYLVITLAAWHLSSAATVTVTAPTSYTNNQDVAGSDDIELAWASREVTGVTSEDPGAWGDDVTPNGTAVFTFAVSEPVANQANASIEESSDSLDASASVVAAGIDANASLLEEDDSLEASGSIDQLEVEILRISWAQIEIPESTETTTTANASINEDSDSLSASSTVAVDSDYSVTEGDDSLSSSGAVAVDANLSATESEDSVSAEASVEGEGTTASLSATEQDDSVAASSAVTVTASLSVSESDDSVSASAAVIITANASITEDGDTLSGSADLSDEIAATLQATESDDSVSSTATVDVSFSAQITESDDTSSANATWGVTAQASITESGDTSDAVVGVLVVANVSFVEEDDSVTAGAGEFFPGLIELAESKGLISLGKTKSGPSISGSRVGSITKTEFPT
jgi:hypothetical protein